MSAVTNCLMDGTDGHALMDIRANAIANRDSILCLEPLLLGAMLMDSRNVGGQGLATSQKFNL